MIRYEVPAGSTIYEACKNAVELANEKNDIVVFVINGLTLAARLDSNWCDIESTYRRMDNMRSLFKDVFNGTPFDGRTEHEIEDDEEDDEAEFVAVGTDFEDPFDTDEPMDEITDKEIDLMRQYADAEGGPFGGIIIHRLLDYIERTCVRG